MLSHLIKNIPNTKNLHIVIGAFDGIHQAHRKIIEHTIKIAKEKNEKSLIFTFEPLPKEHFQHRDFKGRLLPRYIKEEILETFGSDYLIIADFTTIKNFSEKEFVDTLLEKTEHLILYSGDDFRFGSMSGPQYTGSQISHIKEIEMTIDNHPCRSTEIRQLIMDGNIEAANKLLGYEYKIYSHTTCGDKIGRTIKFPTINIIPNQQIIPKNGVYFGEIFINNRLYPSVSYVGSRPSVFGDHLRIESHILDKNFNETIPKATPVTQTFIQRIADEKIFKSLDDLKKMLYNYKEISLGLATKRYNKGIGFL